MRSACNHRAARAAVLVELNGTAGRERWQNGRAYRWIETRVDTSTPVPLRSRLVRCAKSHRPPSPSCVAADRREPGARFTRIAQLECTRLCRRTDAPRVYVEPVVRRTSARFRVSSGPGARSALTSVAARPREREPGALAGRRGSGRRQAHRRLRQSRRRRAAGVADHHAGPSRAWRCVPLAIRRTWLLRVWRPAFMFWRARRASAQSVRRRPQERSCCCTRAAQEEKPRSRRERRRLPGERLLVRDPWRPVRRGRSSMYRPFHLPPCSSSLG